MDQSNTPTLGKPSAPNNPALSRTFSARLSVIGSRSVRWILAWGRSTAAVRPRRPVPEPSSRMRRGWVCALECEGGGGEEGEGGGDV